jgi:hypothetical protein
MTTTWRTTPKSRRHPGGPKPEFCGWTSKGVPKTLIIQKLFAPAQVVMVISQLLISRIYRDLCIQVRIS